MSLSLFQRQSPDFSAQGLIWFWVPASLVIMNDIAAYVCGRRFLCDQERSS